VKDIRKIGMYRKDEHRYLLVRIPTTYSDIFSEGFVSIEALPDMSGVLVKPARYVD